MDNFFISFQGTDIFCGHELAEIQKNVNTCIAPFLKGYSPRSTELKNKTWRFGKNPCVLKKNNMKTSFYIYRLSQIQEEKHTMTLTKQEQAKLYEKGFFTAGANDAIVVITRTKLEELGIKLEPVKKGT